MFFHNSCCPFIRVFSAHSFVVIAWDAFGRKSKLANVFENGKVKFFVPSMVITH
jgi:hypothetical protein